MFKSVEWRKWPIVSGNISAHIYLFSGKPHPVKFPFITLRAASWALWNANCSSTRILLYCQLIAHYPMLSHGSLTNFPASKILCSLFCRAHRLGCNPGVQQAAEIAVKRKRYCNTSWLASSKWPFYFNHLTMDYIYSSNASNLFLFLRKIYSCLWEQHSFIHWVINIAWL